MINVNITLSKEDYDYIINELRAAEQNTYIKYVYDTLDKKEIVERIDMAYNHIDHVLKKLL